MTEKPDQEKLDLDHLRQWIGRTTEASDIVTAQLVKGLRATLFQEIGEPKPGDAAPWTTHWCLAQPVFPMSMLGPDGHPTRGGFLPPVPLPRRMWAGGEIEFIEPLRVGDESTRTSRISDVTMKTGSSQYFLRIRRNTQNSRRKLIISSPELVLQGWVQGRAVDR